ncbi:MAG: ribbon-helix-helix protein, CopG family [Nitrospirota bacterium]
MGTLTVRMPDDTHERLKKLARSRGVSVNKLMEELSVTALVEFDAETRFRARAARGSAKSGLDLLRKLDKASARRPRS